MARGGRIRSPGQERIEARKVEIGRRARKTRRRRTRRKEAEGVPRRMMKE